MVNVSNAMTILCKLIEDSLSYRHEWKWILIALVLTLIVDIA